MSVISSVLQFTDKAIYEESIQTLKLRGLSTSYLQRRYRIGYGRAARIMDQLRDNGFAAPITSQLIRAEAGSRLIFDNPESVVDDLLLNAGIRPRVVETQIRTRILEIGPDEARALLAANYKNRTIRPDVVQRYAKQMQEGEWLLAHQGIAFSKSGRGLDLQHRLLAVIKSGCTIQVMVSEGLDDKVFEIVDKHSKRSTADSLEERLQHVSIAHLLLRIHEAEKRFHTESYVKDFVNLFRGEMDALFSQKIKKVKIVTSTTVRAALVLQMALMPKHATTMLKKLRDLANHETQGYTPMMYAFESAIFAGRLSATSSEGKIELFAKAGKVFNPKYDSATKIVSDASTVSSIKSQLADIVSERTASSH
jgi:hypothetical protein